MGENSNDVRPIPPPAKRTCLHSSIFHETIRKLQVSNDISTKHIMYPIFISDVDDEKSNVPSLPGVYRYGINKLFEPLGALVKYGLQSVLLFGVINNLSKDEMGSNADSAKNPVVRAVPKLKAAFPNLLVACDVCLCPYTKHGHCGVRKDERLDNEQSIRRIAEIAVAYAKAGCDVVAPSDMMDGRVLAIKTGLHEAGVGHFVAVLAYSAKFASVMYGPFRDAAKTSVRFGNRETYQLPTGSAGLAVRAVNRDVQEGCDMLMVKPGSFYLDIVRQTKELHPEIPLFIYQVSGEYAMLYHAAEKGCFTLRAGVMESLTAFRRAGGDCIITYFAPQILQWLREDKMKEYKETVSA